MAVKISYIDWQEGKGSGSWPFTPQPDKPHYNEGDLISNHDNPVWEMDHLDTPVGSDDRITPIHHPWCGYWTKNYKGGPGPEPDPFNSNIYVINWHGASTIYGVHFDGVSLSWVGSYQTPGVDTNGLILYEDSLLTIAGAGGADAELRQIGTGAVDEEFPLLNTYTPFNSYDVRTVINGRLVNGGTGKFYYSDTTTVMVSVHDFVRDKRGFRNTVITGTDGNLYVLDSANFWWNALWHPVTGAYWSDFWNLIEDNICDSTVTAWGGDIKRCSSKLVDLCYYSGYLYSVDYSSIQSPLTKTNPTTLEKIVRYTDTFYLNRITAYNGRIYAIGGVSNCTVYAFRSDDLSLIESLALPFGRALDGDLEVVGNYLIVSTTTYTTSESTLYKLSLDDLTILDSIATLSGTDIIGGQQLAKINNTYVAVAWNDGVSVYNIETMELVDKFELSDIEGDYGFHAQAMVVKHN